MVSWEMKKKNFLLFIQTLEIFFCFKSVTVAMSAFQKTGRFQNQRKNFK
jgi:hypothetical protein